MPNTQESHSANLKHRTHNESLEYGLKNDLKWILDYCEENGMEYDVYFRPRTQTKTLPMYVEDVLRGQIRIESMILLNRVMKFLKISDFESMKERSSSLYSAHLTIVQKMLKYDSFLKTEKTRDYFRGIVLDIYKERVN
jgi:hypothetical protein